MLNWLSRPAIRCGGIDLDGLQIIGGDIGLALSIEEPALLSGTGLIINTSRIIDKTGAIECIRHGILI